MNVGYMPPSITVEWETPIDFYNALNNEFNFNLDPCATDDNHKCNKYFTKADNGLIQSWGAIGFIVTRLTGESLRRG